MVPPVMHFQAWDQDIISGDDFLVNLDEAEKNPVGKAREEPDALIAPKYDHNNTLSRPDNSLAWLLYPVTISPDLDTIQGLLYEIFRYDTYDCNIGSGYLHITSRNV
ncbi:LOW QUALITY PROTEIN: hypothetical protein MXB_4814 [Myxobolus squamalis]|nr:LOW QUALITY PROTEIN: hypothetical protein MXB_4814 [Myxobolus squamalis]